ncbi:hypothetical protein Terro_2527 [Terriglobus roseus DSM 18391]|uniref:Uncharacterized protein n=1 Tax=Terriglobus roseus (strain DSM 18391 / NRRL B-41598 / KBS 63) TaxID=926566 RepID=I3ZGR3_TERRK|nr:hypothetical protein Terro_2163 [Terriglobus roseus DSM 18391]AFL88773.1 hypothetical protein Terro_2527 [Terriglobus roseus DSM 18391]
MRPYVICHMTSSLDGKTNPEVLEQFGRSDLIEETHPKLQGDAWLCDALAFCTWEECL